MYDFRTLNDKDFEHMAVDLLSVLEGKRIERFKPGKDQGVDGRFFAPDRGETIIQCKHWVNSGYGKLLSHLKSVELPKVQKLACERYILVTSVPLSRHQKRELAVTLTPFVLTDSDIFGADDLNNLLAKHHDVESRHYRLWLSSVIPLTQIFSRAILGRSRAELEEIQELAPLYVETRDLRVALERMEKDHVLILTGQPGIGKTTLARQLLLDHVTRGFKLLTIEENLSEAEAAFTDDTEQFFFYDDFLGRTYLEALSPKQDSHTISFIKRVARSENKRLVLTSRTGILNQGIVLSDLFARLFHQQRPYELLVEHLTRMDRARILYNHIWHSALGAAYVDQLYADKRYHTIIGHKNFNPRLISLIVDNARVGDIPPSEYWEFVQRTLDRPDELWDHVFENQLDQAGRDLLFFTVVNWRSISESQLRIAFGAVPMRAADHAGQVELDFRRAAKHASGSVLQRSIDASSHAVRFDVLNPSIADYVERRLSEGNLWGYYISCLRSSSGLIQLRQLHKQNRISVEQFELALQQLVEFESSRTKEEDSFTWSLLQHLLDFASKNALHQAFIRGCLSRVPYRSDVDIEDCLRIVGNCYPYVNSMPKEFFADFLSGILEEYAIPLDNAELISKAIATLQRLGEVDLEAHLRREIIESWDSYALDAVRDHDVLSAYDDPADAQAATGELTHYFRSQLEDFGVDPTDEEVDRLVSKIWVEDVIEANMAPRHQPVHKVEDNLEELSKEREESAAIDELFDRS